MRTQLIFSLFTLVTVSVSSFVNGQDPLDEMYGQAVHAFFRGDSMRAEELLTEVIDAGSQDPRAYYFRGLCQSYGMYFAGSADFETGARLETEGKKVVNVGKALERIQGRARVEIETARSKARLASKARALELQRTRYEEMQQRGGANTNGGIVVPPRTNDPAPAPNALAPNDPFNAGMTKGDPKATEEEPKPVTPTDELGTDPAMPEVPTTTPPVDDPFGN